MQKRAQNKSNRIALIASARTIVEYSTYLGHLLTGLADESRPTVLVCPRECNLDSVILGSAEVIRCSALQSPFIPKFNKKILLEQLIKYEPAILHSLCETTALLTSYMASIMDVRYLLSINSLEDKYCRNSNAIWNCSGVIVPTESILVKITRNTPDIAYRIKHIEIGTFVEDAYSCFPDPSRLVTIITVIKRDNIHKYENLFGALRHLRLDGHEFILVLISDSRADNKLWRMLKAFELLQITTIVSKQINTRSVLAAGDIFIRPQPSKYFDTILLDAMALGTAVAACKGGVDDLIIENETAVVFNPKDEMSIMRTLQKLLNRREFARKIAQNAQQYVKKNHSVSKMLSAILDLYQHASSRTL